MAERVWVCTVCGWMYDESQGVPDEGIEPGTAFEDLPEGFLCPECSAGKEAFEPMEV
ncbi:MAG: rubredoxin [Halorhodospira halophila]|uniref:rubredoxin n=1 Tax=Halorhodospira TaxID=85108 RepID=UPI001911BE02|nr:rubredoxin [Halorhodospira halophila]MCG5533488.1 rubredoxin [Halorhodospira sp. 9621]MCG5538450.1 rubredoxin [Halorhodospira sp. 9622]MCG5541731.1 rubredoxin [Halorhodospira sp. M39old]MCG5544382.1 rubredoxin [Halorhodospira sp. 9628]MCG5546814.1 rubredoxin [Halorhodospira sp. M38]